MPVDINNYPDDWPDIAHAVKDAAGWQCQLCGMLCRQPGEPFDTHRRTLTVAHWEHDTQAEAVFVVSLCAPCHLRHDVEHHVANRRRKARAAQAEAGQLELERIV